MVNYLYFFRKTTKLYKSWDQGVTLGSLGRIKTYKIYTRLSTTSTMTTSSGTSRSSSSTSTSEGSGQKWIWGSKDFSVAGKCSKCNRQNSSIMGLPFANAISYISYCLKLINGIKILVQKAWDVTIPGLTKNSVSISDDFIWILYCDIVCQPIYAIQIPRQWCCQSLQSS